MFRLRRPELRKENRIGFANFDHEKISFYRCAGVKLVIGQSRLGDFRMTRPANRTWLLLIIAIVLTIFRLWVGYNWFNELGWKAPWAGSGGFGCDSYHFNASQGELHGLCDWMQREADHPAVGLYGDFVRNLVIPNFAFFSWLTILTEGFITVSLFFGFLTRLGGIIGTLWAISLLIGLVGVPGESWSLYVLGFILPSLVFAIIGARFQFSIDALLAKRYEDWAANNSLWGKLVRLASGSKPGSAGVI